MAKTLVVALLSCAFPLQLIPAYAADPSPPPLSTAQAQSPSEKGQPKPYVVDPADARVNYPHGEVDHFPAKHIIDALPDLTDAQRSQIEAIYSDRAPEYASLQMQMHDLRRSIWEKVRNVLTPAQVEKLEAQQESEDQTPTQSSGDRAGTGSPQAK